MSDTSINCVALIDNRVATKFDQQEGLTERDNPINSKSNDKGRFGGLFY